jgi:3'-5' exoribonuclease
MLQSLAFLPDSAARTSHAARMSPLTIAALREQAGEKPLLAAVHAQLQSRSTRTTKNGKPYLELSLADATGHFTLKIWSDSPVYQDADALPLSSVEAAEDSVRRLEAEWTQSQYGLETKNLSFHKPEADALALFFAGEPALKERQDADYVDIVRLCESILDPRLHALCQRFFEKEGNRFRRTAAAKKNHHARRGGLVEHVAQMMRSAAALCHVYTELNRDLLITGVLFHDCGKLWENSYPECGFTQELDLCGELMGHIPRGMEIVNMLWREIMESPEAADWKTLKPSNNITRLHLLHLIGSHHGEHQFGSPVLPRTPEAFALHYIDNMDAKLEMLRDAYGQSQEIAPQIFERVFPLPTNLVKPLSAFVLPRENAAAREADDAPPAE